MKVKVGDVLEFRPIGDEAVVPNPSFGHLLASQGKTTHKERNVLSGEFEYVANISLRKEDEMKTTFGLGMPNRNALFGLCLIERQQRWRMLYAHGAQKTGEIL